MSYDNQRIKIIEICKSILPTVDRILAFSEGGVDGKSLPFFIKNGDSIDNINQIKWDENCVQNLAPYLHGFKGKSGIVAKPCDVRAIVNYIREKQLKRDNIYIIGVDCMGMKDSVGNLLPGCAECNVHKPPIWDVHVENTNFVEYERTTHKLPVASEERLKAFQKEMEKCILCYSCRQSCYGCYCEVCFMERGWEAIEPDLSAKMTYHLGRAMHLAGRCVECGVCERACASGVNIRYLIQEVTAFIEEFYDYRTGLDLQDLSAMTSFKIDDKEIGFIGGEACG